MASTERNQQDQNANFMTTQWSLVVTAGKTSSPDSRRALEHLCQAYWYPLYTYVRYRVSDIHEAHDLTQAFFAELLEKNHVRSADAERGRFRSFLLTAFKNFLSKQWEKSRALKRGGGRLPISLDFDSADSSYHGEPASGLTPEQIYDQQWAIALLEQTLTRLEGEFKHDSKSNQFEELKAFIIGDHSGANYKQAANQLGLTEAATRKAVSRLRRRYGELLRDEIAQTVSSPDEVEQEIGNLFSTFSSEK